ncbi:ArsR/SmtB family transcription factor [Streptomyces sp. NPDC058319]|uniref:ArsR/SmtB family transcription factor n=1 Tax=unclassified Streptomyces TaxID=2593676 RepID=UPI0036F118D7
MLRIHFTDADLGMLRVAGRPDPLWETVLGMQQLMGGTGTPVAFAAWRRRAAREIAERRLGSAARLLCRLAPPRVYFPDFLTPPEAGGGLAEGLDALRGTPPARLRAEVIRTGLPQERGARRLSWLRGLVTGDRERLEELAQALRLLHDALVAPAWSGVARGVHADRAVRGRAVLDGGAHRLLGSLRPFAAWEPPVLHVTYPVDTDLHLGGRGLRLVPSWFCWRMPVSMADPDLPPVLVHPVEHPLTSAVGQCRRPAALAALLGRTRWQVLGALRRPATTGELARLLDVSPASASTHTKTLREARLVASHRVGGSTLHCLTPLGAALLEGEVPSAPTD